MGDETPEQQLLKLIEQPQASGAQPAGDSKDPKADTAAAAKAKKGLNFKSLLTPSGWKGVLSYAKEQGATLAKQKPEVYSLRSFNRFFRIALGAGGIVMFCYIAYAAYVMNSEFHELSDSTQKEMADLPMSGGRMLDPNFFEDIAKRNIFAPMEKKLEPELALESGVSKAALVEMAKDIKLTGISVNPTDESRTFCMIEDLKKNTTSFLKVGDGIAGFTISKIGPDSVELKYQKEAIELR